MKSTLISLTNNLKHIDRAGLLKCAKIIGKQISLIILALILSSIFLLATGYDPFIVIKAIAKGVTAGLGGTVRWTIPYAFAGLAICLTFRANIFNMGVDGQLYIGAIAATYLSMMLSDFPPVIAITGTIIFASIAGGLFAVIPALMKIKLKCDEVVTTILLNYVAYYFTDFVVLGPMLGKGTLAAARSTDYIPENLWLAKLDFLPSSGVTIGLYLAIALTIGMAVLLYKTNLGYEVKICGANPRMAEYGGINSGRVILTIMVLSGVIAGLAGAVEILGVHHRFPIRFSNQVGFDGVVVSLLANNNPIGVLFTAFFFGALKNGAMTMQRIADVPSALIDIVRGIIIFTISIDFALLKFKKYKAGKQRKKEEQ